MFIGIDHGTTAMRFSDGERCFKIPRREAVTFAISDLFTIWPKEEIEGIAVTYSMGDNFSSITRIQNLKNRGVVSREGAGEYIGGGTRVFDEVASSGIRAIALPGLHRGSDTDPRFKVYSHQASPEKIGIAYEGYRLLGKDCIISDVSSNTVSILVIEGKITGAFDACIFAPGIVHGALDLDAIRSIDEGKISANDAFLHAGVQVLPEEERIPALAMFAAMECAALRLLAPAAPVALCGSQAAAIGDQVSSLLGQVVLVLDEWTAAKGLSRIAADVFAGVPDILGIKVQL